MATVRSKPVSYSIAHRFVFTLGASIFRGGIGFTSSLLLARWLGPEDYGNMFFLVGTFVAVRTLLDMGTSSAFFTFLSQQSHSGEFVRAYYLWLAIQFLLPILLIGFIFPDKWIANIWKGEPRSLVLLAAAASFMQNGFWAVVSNHGESKRHTILVQSVATGISIFHLAALVFLWFGGWLGLYAILAATAVEYLLAGALVLRRLFFFTDKSSDAGVAEMMPALQKYVSYCLPIVPYSVLGFAAEFADRWLLQSYGGSVEQAFYSVGAQFSSVALIATSSVLRIFWKEMAEANHRGDYARMKLIYRKVSRLLFLVGALTAGYLVPWSSTILELLLGPAYVTGATTLAIMFLYPLHQALGQITSALLYATERVSIQVLSGMVQMVLGIVFTYLMLAPPDAFIPGFGFASNGLAMKMVALQFIGVNAVMYIIARKWRWDFDWTYQPIGLAGCLSIGWLVHSISTSLVAKAMPVPGQMIVAAFLYFCLSCVLIFLFPSLAGATRSELIDLGRRFVNGNFFLRS